MNFNKKFWTMTLSAAMAASLLAGCGTSGSSADASASGSQGSNPGGEDGVFTIAYAPNESTTESADARNGLAKDLGEFLGCEVEEIQASDYNAIIEALRTGKPVQPKVFSHQIAYNLIPQIGGEQYEGYTSEEMKMQNEGRKIMHLPDLRVTCTCVRVPVVRSHSISVTLRFDKPVSVREARHAIAAAPGCRLVDDLGNHEYPMPLDTSDQDLVYVGRIRPDLTDDNGLTLWCCGDQIRKGAATNTIQVAELLIEK